MTMVVCAAALVGQAPKAEKPMALDPVTQGRVYAAYTGAREWSFGLANKLCYRNPMVPLLNRARQKSDAVYSYTLYHLEEGAAKQICEAYGISRMTLAKVIADPRSQDVDFIPETNGDGGIAMATATNFSRGTRFNPRKVVLPASIARRIGYKNPDPNAPPPPPPWRPESYTSDGRRIPGRAADPEIEQRKKEIKERAKNTVIKDPIPASP
ncbi:MAG: hypothetical protein P4L67_04785 [Candidatus Pacebacteria bacterium]|nr:hypothetical protein [Candidatus Paceibacterota bacterium]